MPFPIVSKGSESRQRLSILRSIGRLFTGNNVIRMTNGKAIDLNSAGPGVAESFDAIGGKDKIQIKRAIFQLHEILASFDVLLSLSSSANPSS